MYIGRTAMVASILVGSMFSSYGAATTLNEGTSGELSWGTSASATTNAVAVGRKELQQGFLRKRQKRVQWRLALKAKPRRSMR